MSHRLTIIAVTLATSVLAAGKTCLAAPNVAVQYSIRSYWGFIPRHDGFNPGTTFAEAGDTYHWERSPPVDYPKSYTAQVSGMVGANGTNGLGLMRFTANASASDNTTVFPLEPPAFYPNQPFYADISGRWNDTLTLPAGQTNTVYLQFEVDGSSSLALRNDEFTATYVFPDHPADSFAGNYAKSEIGISILSPGVSISEATYSKGVGVSPVTFTTDEWHNWQFFNATGLGFHGTALLAVNAPLSGDPSVRPFVFSAGVGIVVDNGSANVDLGHTISFLGVTDANGVPISGASFESGLTPAVVPEPSSIALASCGVLGLIACVWRRRTR